MAFDRSLRWLTLPLFLAVGLLAGCADCKAGGADDADVVTAPMMTTGRDGGDDGGDAGRDAGFVSVLPIPASSVAQMLNPDGLPAYTGPTGSVEGTVVVTGEPAPETPADFSRCPDAAKIWGHSFREGASLTGKTGARALADAVVVVTGYRGYFVPEKSESRELKIEGCGYTARTVTLTFGQRLEVRNTSKDFWIPVLEPGSTSVMMMATPNGDPTRIYPKRPGHYLLLDRDRKYAVADVYAFLHPLHAATNLSGHYRIDGLPVGKLKVSTTHPQIGTSAESEIDVKADVVQTVDLVLKNVNHDAGTPPQDAGPDAARPRAPR